MTPHYADDWLTVYHGDARAVMAEIPAESVHCVVTSPPYWGLRDYGTASWIGGDEACDHLGPPGGGTAASGLFHPDNGLTQATVEAKVEQRRQGYRSVCGKCGAIRQDSQLGLEPTPEQYVENMVAVFREVRRVLRSDGTVWLNLGDSYAAGKTGRDDEGTSGGLGGDRWPGHGGGNHPGSGNPGNGRTRAAPPGLKPKDLVGIPWRVAFALQADGWYLRSDIIWSKPNPMPESVTDRPTKSHEYLFLLSKSARYYYDADAVREPPAESVVQRAAYLTAGTKLAANKDRNDGDKGQRTSFADYLGGRNLRSVWSIATAPYPGAHFATFPPKLVEPCIKAGTSEKGVCPECGAPWVRMVELGGASPRETLKRVGAMDKSAVVAGRDGSLGGRQGIQHAGGLGDGLRPRETTGWRPSCVHQGDNDGSTASELRQGLDPVEVPIVASGSIATQSHPELGTLRTRAAVVAVGPDTMPPSGNGGHQPLLTVPATVLDPFAGSGTTGMVAQSLSRRAILIDLSLEYLGQLMDRNREVPLGL